MRAAVVAAALLVPAIFSPVPTASFAAASVALPTLPPAPEALVAAARAAEALDLPGPVPGPLLGPISRAEAADAAPGVCAGMNVVTAITGQGDATRVTIKTSSVSFAIGSVPSTWWKRPPVTTPVWQLYFRGLMWTKNVAERAIATGDAAAMDALVRTAAASVRHSPDPGTPTAGWDEGANLRRQEALNCLYRASNGDARLLPAINATSRANMDVARYYGLPLRKPHNHGVMANLALLDAGELLDNATWRQTAVRRLATDSAGAFTPRGVSIEQSSTYHVFNTDIWHLVSQTLAAYPDPAISSRAAAIAARAAHARRVTAHLTDPLGRLVPYGDSNDGAGLVEPQSRGAFRDDDAGVLTGRWSWTDPQTSYYLVRYGPRMVAHGHQDRGQLVWTTLGVPVLVDPGTFSYDPGSYAAHADAATGHNVQIARGRSLDLTASVSVTRATASGTAHAVSLKDALYGVRHARNWLIDNAKRRVSVTDSLPAPGVTTLHFDRTWTARSLSADKRTVTLRHPSGRTAIAVASHPMTIYRGSTRPVLGWQFPAYGSRTSAVQLVMYPPAGTSSITVTVT